MGRLEHLADVVSYSFIIGVEAILESVECVEEGVDEGDGEWGAGGVDGVGLGTVGVNGCIGNNAGICLSLSEKEVRCGKGINWCCCW